ncbi:MAG: 2-C-methyl-D-erythritol 4-phosphate cytidylyltransferase [Lachnospiraceae bacterium]|nr:2-C-methyl-D-erythritol 4-phosphate cytidylyltransferase [Lachnospiraceae bacterium]
MKKKCTAILLAAGAGRRMESNVAKQYMLLGNKPVIWYGLQAFACSPMIDDIILVVGRGEIPYVQKELIEKYGFSKVRSIVEGGAERYHSVENALKLLREGTAFAENREGYIFIHDGARPLVTEKIIEDTYKAAEACGACCAAVPVKDTIKLADEDGFALQTPKRSSLYAVQTPQVFSAPLIFEAYAKLQKQEKALAESGVFPTDDAMVVEQLMGRKVKLVEASYENLKITTPEDLELAEGILRKRRS